MRILLATAVAIAPLMAASGASAEVVINSVRTTPITTSNATSTGADSIRIASGGAINVTSGAAVTVDSNHSFALDGLGQINMLQSENGATAILVNGGTQASLDVDGPIRITDGRTDTDLDTDKDGDADGPLATGTGRFGIRVAGNAPVTGNIVVDRLGDIQVEGNQSAAVSVEAPLIGNLSFLGKAEVVGDNSFGVRTNTVTGNVDLMGSVTVRGENSVAASVEGDVSGRVLVGSTLSATGFRVTGVVDRPAGFVETAENDPRLSFTDELDADDLLTGGPALRIAGNVGGGVTLDTAPAYSAAGIEGDDDGDGVKNGDEDLDGDGVINRLDTDRDGDGVIDANEGTARVESFGSAPALEVGSATQSITLGGAGGPQYGLINRGSVIGQGTFSGFKGTAMRVGGNAGQTATIAGGILNEGTIQATSRDADAVGVHLATGAVAPTFVNRGTVSGGVATEQAGRTATALLIDSGASLPSLENDGSILATTADAGVNLVAVQDLSGTLQNIVNTRSVLAVSTANPADGAPGPATAFDLRANTSGVTLRQDGVASSGADSDGDGVADVREPNIIGAIQFGSGADVLDVRNGAIRGDISFGAGADRLAITGGATVTGALSDSDGILAIDVQNGVLSATQTTAVNASQLTVGRDGDLIVTIDAKSGATGTFNVSGNATLVDGAGLGIRLTSLLQPGVQDEFLLIDAGTLNFGQIDTASLSANSPFLYVVTPRVDPAESRVFADVRLRTSDEAGFIPVESAAYEAFYGAIAQDGSSAVREAFLAQTGREGFINLYEQLLPEHSGGPLLSLASGVDAVTRALVGRNATAAPGQTSAWLQEINFYADKDRTDTYGFRSEGFGVAGGIERMTGLGAVGLSAAFTTADLEDPESEAEEVLSANLLELGLYWRAQGQRWTTWARAAAGYATFESERRLVGAGLNLSNEADWSGLSLAAAAGASYEQAFGRLILRPEAYVEYFGLSQEGYAETGGGDGFDLEIDDREGHLLAATAAINLGWSMGSNSWLRPELRVGWRQNISVDPGETIGRFRAGGGDFRLTPDTIEGGGPIAGLRLNVGNELGMLSVSVDAEMIEDYVRYMLFLRASFRF